MDSDRTHNDAGAATSRGDLPRRAPIISALPPSDGRNWDCQCARCGSSCDHEDCWNCEDGYSHHDCGEDCCCCLRPEDNVACDICGGSGHWYACISSPEFCQANPLPGREEIPRGKIEWFVSPEAP